MTPKDLLGRTLQVGDQVLTNEHYSTHMTLLSKVKRITPKRYIVIEIDDWKWDVNRTKQTKFQREIRKSPDKFLVIDAQLEYNKKHFPEDYI